MRLSGLFSSSGSEGSFSQISNKSFAPSSVQEVPERFDRSLTLIASKALISLNLA